MDQVIDSESCTECGHDHLPLPREIWYVSRQDECVEVGCDCGSYTAPSKAHPRVYKCSICERMVTRVWRPPTGGSQACDDCHNGDHG